MALVVCVFWEEELGRDKMGLSREEAIDRGGEPLPVTLQRAGLLVLEEIACLL